MEEAGSEREAAHTSTRGGRICSKHNEDLEEAGSEREAANTMRRPDLKGRLLIHPQEEADLLH
jgi:hypothetical protein